MKALILALTLIFGTGFAFSQKYAYIDSDYILSKLPEYADAKDKLDKLADRWTKEIEQRYEILRPAEERKKRLEEIETLEKEAMEMQATRFGVNGDYFAKRQELIKPIQDRVYDAMQAVASKRSYTMVFDKANQSNLVYADSKSDISDMVLKELESGGDN